MPFGGESYGDVGLSPSGGCFYNGSPVPFGGESYGDGPSGATGRIPSACLQCLSAVSPMGTQVVELRCLHSRHPSPVPFGGESYGDRHKTLVAAVKAEVSSAFRR